MSERRVLDSGRPPAHRAARVEGHELPATRRAFATPDNLSTARPKVGGDVRRLRPNPVSAGRTACRGSTPKMLRPIPPRFKQLMDGAARRSRSSTTRGDRACVSSRCDDAGRQTPCWDPMRACAAFWLAAGLSLKRLRGRWRSVRRWRARDRRTRRGHVQPYRPGGSAVPTATRTSPLRGRRGLQVNILPPPAIRRRVEAGRRSG